MYKEFFGFVELPFSIVPNSRYLFLSQRHKEAIQHLRAGLGDGGGFAMLSGEVGTGKTTVARAMLKSLDPTTQAGFILNPTFSDIELLQAICDEFSIQYPTDATLKQLSQAIYQFLLHSHAHGKQTLLVIDEAQHLAADVLEQLRLLTNLETESRKLLKVLLIGQPELQQKLQMPQLRQLAQRITGRYHLLPLNIEETAKYIQFRLDLAGGERDLFAVKSLKLIGVQTQGIPRLINLVCDAALKQAYQIGEHKPSHATVQSACEEVMAFQSSFNVSAKIAPPKRSGMALTASVVIGLGLAWLGYQWTPVMAQPWIEQQIEAQHPQQPDVEITQEVMPPSLTEALVRSTSLEEPLAELYKVWGYQASMLDRFCADNDNSLFRCESAMGALSDIEQLGFPVVLTLHVNGQASYAVLYHLGADTVQLLVDGQRLEFETKWLKELWSGEYHYIWQSVWHATLKPGMRGRAVAMLNERLSLLMGDSYDGSDRFDAELKRKVEMFQRWQGLNVDGIAGVRTLRRLELMTQTNPPVLSVVKEDV
ncbi:ExeA family protein [Vibrio proteolyticus]